MGWWNDNTVVEDEPVLLGGETCGKTGFERLTEDGEAEGEGGTVLVEVSLGDIFVQAGQVFGVEGAGRRVVAGVIPVFPEGESVRPEGVDQAG